LEHGYSREIAYNYTLKETQKVAYIQKRRNESFAKLPFAYKLFKLFTKGIMKKMYPKVGWETEWILFNDKEIHLNFNTCIYVDMMLHFGCPELCTVFCKNDEIIFSGYEPKNMFLKEWNNRRGGITL